jgi:D-alanyl-D-alanine carboxypeptidase
VPGGDAITIRQLLNMTSGLPEFTNTEQMSDRLLADPQSVWTPQQALAIAFDPASTRPSGAPAPERGKYFYDNTNYVLLGLVIERVTRAPAADAMRTRIFEPLGLRNTALPANDDATIPDPHADGYVFDLPPDRLRAVDATNWNPSWAWTAGAVISTPTDLAKYVEALTDGRLLGEDLQRQRLESDFVAAAADDDRVSYGLGIARAGGFYGHSGGIFGYSGWALHSPSRRTTIVLYTTTLASPYDPNPARTLLETVSKELFGEVLVPAA